MSSIGSFSSGVYDSHIKSSLDSYLDSREWGVCKDCTRPGWCLAEECCRNIYLDQRREERRKKKEGQ